jgi:PAS domain S-box-containing protein
VAAEGERDVKKVAPPPAFARPGFARSPVAAVLLLAMATGVTGSIYLRHQAAQFHEAAERTLSSVAELKAGQISSWYSGCREDAETILRNPMTMSRIRQFLSAPSGTDPAEDIQAWMESRVELHRYRQLVLYDAGGVPRLHAPASLPGSQVPPLTGHPKFQTALRTGGVQAIDLHPAPADPGRFSLGFWVPVPCVPGAKAPAIGVVFLDIDPDQSLFPLVQSWPTPSRTAETVLSRREGNDVVYLNRLRHRANVPLSFRLPIDPTRPVPSAMAALGQEGIVNGPDYRGVSVLAAVRGIPGTPWFMVAKQDLTEVDAPLRDRSRMAGGVLLLVFLAAALGVNQLWRRRETQLLHQRISLEQEATERFRTLIESLPQMVWTSLPDGRCDYLSPQWVEYTGMPQQDQLGHAWTEQLHPEDRPRAQHDWQEAVVTGRNLALEFRVRRSDGAYHWFYARAVPLRDGTGRITKWFATNTDINQRKRAEEALQREREFSRLLLESMVAGVVACDAEGKLSLFNRMARVWHGSDATPMPPEEWAEHYGLFLEDGRTPMTRETVPLARALRGETLRDVGMVIRARGQPPRRIASNGAPLRDAQGRLLGAVMIMHDITEQCRAEEALKRTAEVLSQSNEEVRQFAYIVSHDLRSPLVNFRGFVSELRRSLATLDLLLRPAINQLGETDRSSADRIFRQDVPDALGFIDSSVVRMDRMISSLLRLSRLGRQEPSPERLDLGLLVSEIVASLDSQIQARGGTVTVLPLPEVTADRTCLEQILGNILGNAVAYLDPARPGRVEIAGELAGTELLVKISDNGRGISQDDREKVFAPFRRAGSADVPGEGMGLAYVQALVRRQGGRIWFNSEPGVGTTFSFVLPVAVS